MEPYAEASCVFKVNAKCQACKMGMMEILGSVCGVYDFEIHSEEGLGKLHAVVEPNLFLKALARKRGEGDHPQAKSVKLRHPKLNRNYYYYDDYDSYNHKYGCNYGAINDPNNYNRALPDYVGHPSYHYSSIPPCYHGSNPYYYGSALPPARYVPHYPSKEYDQYDDESLSFCSIM